MRGTSRFGFAGVPNAPNIELSLSKHKERARVSALRLSWALIEQRKRKKPPVRNRLGSLAAIGLVLARCARCSVVLGAVQCCALCSAGGGAWGDVQCCALCNAVRSEALCAVKRWALCNGARYVVLRAVHCCALCSTAHCLALRAM